MDPFGSLRTPTLVCLTYLNMDPKGSLDNMPKKIKASFELEHFHPLKIVGKTGVRLRLEIPKELSQELNLKAGEGVDLWVDRKGRKLVYEV